MHHDRPDTHAREKYQVIDDTSLLKSATYSFSKVLEVSTQETKGVDLEAGVLHGSTAILDYNCLPPEALQVGQRLCKYRHPVQLTERTLLQVSTCLDRIARGLRKQ